MKDYMPISCELYDQLEAIAIRHRMSQITYLTETGEKKTAQGKIVDIYAEKGADYCKLEDGTVMRLDRLKTITVGDEKIL